MASPTPMEISDTANEHPDNEPSTCVFAYISSILDGQMMHIHPTTLAWPRTVVKRDIIAVNPYVGGGIALKLPGRRFNPTPEQRKRADAWADKHAGVMKASPGYRLLALESYDVVKVMKQIFDLNQESWKEGIWQRSRSYPSNIIADTLDVAMQSAETRMARGEVEAEAKLLRQNLKLLEACELTRRPWVFKGSKVPLPPILMRQLHTITKPMITTQGADFMTSSINLVQVNPSITVQFYFFLNLFVLLHSIDLCIRFYYENHMHEFISELEASANNLLECYHHGCPEHSALFPDWAYLNEWASSGTSSLTPPQASYAMEAFKFMKKPENQDALFASYRSETCNDDRSYFALQLFMTGWEQLHVDGSSYTPMNSESPKKSSDCADSQKTSLSSM